MHTMYTLCTVLVLQTWLRKLWLHAVPTPVGSYPSPASFAALRSRRIPAVQPQTDTGEVGGELRSWLGGPTVRRPPLQAPAS